MELPLCVEHDTWLVYDGNAGIKRKIKIDEMKFYAGYSEFRLAAGLF